MDISEIQHWYDALLRSIPAFLPMNEVLPSHNATTSQLSADFGHCDTVSAWIALTSTASLEKLPNFPSDIFSEIREQLYSPDVIEKYKGKLGKIVDQINSSGIGVTSSFMAHEETHFYQLIGTPFGRLLSEFDRVFAFDMSLFTRHILDLFPDELFRPPLAQWFAKDVKDLSKLKQEQAATLAMLAFSFVQALAIKFAFFGKIYTITGETVEQPVTIGSVITLWTLFLIAIDRVEGEDSSPSINQVTHPHELRTRMSEHDSACPMVGDRYLTPLDIFEGVALEIQLNWLRRIYREKSTLSQILRLVNPGWINPEYLTTRRMIGQTLSDTPWPWRRSLLLILSDLALSGPTHNDYFKSEREIIYWEDIHPGYRFKRALEVVKQKSPKLTGVVAKDYGPVTDLVCNSLGWDHPVEMARHLTEVGGRGQVAFTYNAWCEL